MTHYLNLLGQKYLLLITSWASTAQMCVFIIITETLLATLLEMVLYFSRRNEHLTYFALQSLQTITLLNLGGIFDEAFKKKVGSFLWLSMFMVKLLWEQPWCIHFLWFDFSHVWDFRYSNPGNWIPKTVSSISWSWDLLIKLQPLLFNFRPALLSHH